MYRRPAATQTDPAVASPPSDDVQCLTWSPTSNYLVAGAWDNSVSCWEIAPNGESQPRAATQMEGPVLDTAWTDDGTKVFCAGGDCTAKLWDLESSSLTNVAQHDAPIKTCHWIPQHQLLMTGSWDKTVRFWDCRAPQAAATMQLDERCYAADVCGELAVVAANQIIHVYDLTAGPTEFHKQASTLKMQTRCISCFPSRDGYALGTIQGRVAICYVSEGPQERNFSYRCHRVEVPGSHSTKKFDIYGVNSISFHPRLGTFATTGGDGVFAFWDKDARSKIKEYTPATVDKLPAKMRMPISASAFNADGSMFAYAQSYDWSMGHGKKKQLNSVAIRIHATPDQEVTYQAPKKK